ncbi:cupin domain-containing protein [Oxalobacteraceae bacterium CAVE-383]|nr:cupin domain-containing protein [Oxalobacteraceae bacterium CAVE-383]
MNITRFDAAQPYFPPNHEGMHCMRLQGREAGPADTAWIGVSHILPGGGTTLDASAVEKFYVVLEGHVTIVTENGEETLAMHDSCRLAPGEKRALKNRTNRTASILLVMPFEKPA